MIKVCMKVILWVTAILLAAIAIISAADIGIKDSFMVYPKMAVALGLIVLCVLGIFSASGKKPAVGVVTAVTGIIIFVIVSRIMLFLCEDDSLTLIYEGKEYAALRSEDFHHPSYSLYEDLGPVFRGNDVFFRLEESGETPRGYVLSDLSSGTEIHVSWDYLTNILEVTDSEQKQSDIG